MFIKKIIIGIVCLFMLSVSIANDLSVINSLSLGGDEDLVDDFDYKNVEAMPIPMISGKLILKPLNNKELLSKGHVGVEKGNTGSGEEDYIEIELPINELEDNNFKLTPQEYGTNNHPFTTSRVDYYPTLVRRHPYRSAGKLFFEMNGRGYVCSASLIKPGVVVTAAHCVSDFGSLQFATNFQFLPAYYNGRAFYGIWKAKDVVVMGAYLDGSGNCTVPGVVCDNDIALIILEPKRTKQGFTFAGHGAGWYGYGWNGYGFTGSSIANGNIGLMTQLGYPVSHDDGQLMQRTDSQAFIDSSLSFNAVMGSRQTGGSSGGPWLINFGVEAVLNGTSLGSDANSNVIVGVTSWGYNSTDPKQLGASSFTDQNIVPLMEFVCNNYPDNCDKTRPF